MLEEIARRVRRDCLAHLPRGLTSDTREMLVHAVEMGIGKALGAVAHLIEEGDADVPDGGAAPQPDPAPTDGPGDTLPGDDGSDAPTE